MPLPRCKFGGDLARSEGSDTDIEVSGLRAKFSKEMIRDVLVRTLSTLCN